MTPMATPNAQRLLGVITDDDVAALSARNEQRAAAAIARMGPRYCCHRANSPVRYPPIQMRRSSDWAPVGHIGDTPIVPLPESLRRVLRGGAR